MLFNANSVKLNEVDINLPNLSNTITKWFLNINFIRVTKSNVDHQTQETESSESFKGVVQNLDFRDLKLKPEGQRAFTWKMIHALPSLQLTNDDIIKYKDVRYRVMSIKDYQEYGFVEYHVMEDYK